MSKRGHQKYFCFRFDVDTHKCLCDGVPNLIKLMEELRVQATFFVNPGKAVAPVHFLLKKLNPPTRIGAINAPQLSAMQKLGLRDYVYAALVNPELSQYYAKQIAALAKHGHEVGLHGGHNHELWMDQANTWDQEKVSSELTWGLHALRCVLPRSIPVVGFASPGWNGAPIIWKELHNLGFQYVADLHGKGKTQSDSSQQRFLPNLTTTLAGEPGGIGYIESGRARGWSDQVILQDFKQQLLQSHRYAIVYDHPYFAGVQALPLIKKMFTVAADQGFRITTLADIAQKL